MSIFVGRQTLQTRLRIWAQHAPVIEEQMRAAAEDAQHDYFEYLYVRRDDGRRTIQLSAGNHPVAMDDNNSFQIEGGAALVLSQETTFGHVVVLIHPYETSGKAVKPIFWGLFDSPADVTAGKWLELAVHDFSRCCRASSAVDETVYRSDRFRLQWLKVRSWILLLRGRLPGCTKLIRATPSWRRRIVTGVFVGVTTLTALLNLPSMLATLSGYTAPALWALWHQKPPAGGASASASQASSPTAPSAESSLLKANPIQTAPPAAVVEMPVISGRYTFCPTASDQVSPKLLDFLHDVRTHAGKIAFFDVRVDIDCVLDKQPDYEAPFGRLQEPGEVRYLLRVPAIRDGDHITSQQWISGKRDPSVLSTMYSDNGSTIVMHSRNDSHNPLSRFQPHVEGINDILYGPYAIKESVDDAAITFDLNAPFLDSATLQQATFVADKLRSAQALPTPASTPAAEQGGS